LPIPGGDSRRASRLVTHPMRGKRPILKGWSDQPTADQQTVVEWVKAGNLGVRTGRVSGVVVVDDDSPDGSAVVHLGLPATPTVVTGGGGRHYYFRCPAVGWAIRLASSPPMSTFVAMAASRSCRLHSSRDWRVYEWLPGRSPEEIVLADLPAQVLERLRPKPRASTSAVANPDARQASDQRLVRYAEAALRSCTDLVAQAPEGTRNQELNRQAFQVGRYVGAELLDAPTQSHRCRRLRASSGLR